MSGSGPAAHHAGDLRRNTIRAILLVCLAGVLFVVMNAMVKGLTASHNQVMIIWARYFFHVLTVLVFFPRALADVIRTPRKDIQIGRSILLLASTICNFAALYYLPLADVASIIFIGPILVVILAVLLLRERVGLARWLLVAMGFAGALMIVRPGGGTLGIGALLAFGCALSYAFYQISTRIVRESNPIVSLLYGGLVGMVVYSVLVPFWWEWPSPGVWAMMVLVGALGAGGHLLMIMALQMAEASKISAFTYVQLLWAMLASFLVFGDVPTVGTMVGALVIAGSGLLMYRQSLIEARRQAEANL